jgi:type I phosphodiesterase/nucleotide pyrophosphatase
MRSKLGAVAIASAAVAAVALPVGASSAHVPSDHRDRGGPGGRHDHGGRGDGLHGHGSVKHVLLISLDGLHQSDLRWFVRNNPGSELAALTHGGAQYSHAQTPVPSDSDPGMTAQMTGGDPRTTGVFYDVEYNHSLLEAGTTACHGQPTGADVVYDSPDDVNSTRLDAGQGLAGLPGSILNMTSRPQDLLNPATFPVDPATCKPISPSSYLKVNTIFNVAHDAGLRTAWSDKHPVYTSFNGAAGNGIDDSFDPEIDSIALKPDGTPYPGNIAWTGDNAATMQYDSYKVKAILNEIDGFDHSGKTQVGVPAVFGMNFQTVSTAEKLPISDGLAGGYMPGTRIPGPLLQRALTYVDQQLAAMVTELRSQGQLDSTAIIVSAKHGQSPQNPNDLTRIDDGPIIAGLNAAWTQAHPGAPNLVAATTNDDAIMMWLSDRSRAAADFASNYLLTHSATGNTADGGTRTLSQSGLRRAFAGTAAARYFGVSPSDPRHPDVWGIVQHGVVYTGGTAKIAEHGGADPQDRGVPIIVYAPGVVSPGVFPERLQTTSIAPTVVKLLGLNPNSLDAVRIQGTPMLPGVH